MKADPFNTQAARTYLEGPPRQVPGYSSLHTMISLLLAERASPQSRVLVLGAGGGQEIKSLAGAHPQWSFVGVDPSPEMLELARRETAAQAARVSLLEGYIVDAPEGPFDAATAILVFHFISREERLRTISQVRHRLKAGAPFVVVHLSFPQTEPERSLWIARHVAFGLPNDTYSAHIEAAREAISTRLTVLSPEDDVAMLRQGGFADVTLFYAGLSIKGWVAYAS